MKAWSPGGTRLRHPYRGSPGLGLDGDLRSDSDSPPRLVHRHPFDCRYRADQGRCYASAKRYVLAFECPVIISPIHPPDPASDQPNGRTAENGVRRRITAPQRETHTHLGRARGSRAE
jgi:hypothetical protein